MRVIDDLKIAARNLRKAPGFTLAAVITLALGIGANAAVFGAVDAVLLRSIALTDSDRLVVIWETAPARALPLVEVSYRNFLDWREQSQSFEDMAAYGSVNWSLLRDTPARSARVPTAAVSAQFFDVLGTAPLIGRGFVAEEDRRGAGRVVVLSHGFWQREFGGSTDIVGTTTHFGGQPYTVVGVMPAKFQYPKGAELWTPLAPQLAASESRWKLDTLESRGFGVLFVIGRLKEHVTNAQATVELDGIVRHLPENRGGATGAPVVVLTPILNHLLGPVRAAVILLFGLVGLVLAIACANVVGLLLTRATVRRREVAVRMALGASRLRILREWFAESALIAAMAGLASLVIARGALHGLIALAPTGIPNLETAALDSRVLAFQALLGVCTAIICAVVPAV